MILFYLHNIESLKENERILNELDLWKFFV